MSLEVPGLPGTSAASIEELLVTVGRGTHQETVSGVDGADIQLGPLHRRRHHHHQEQERRATRDLILNSGHEVPARSRVVGSLGRLMVDLYHYENLLAKRQATCVAQPACLFWV